MFHIALGELELFIISFVRKYVFGALESILCLAPFGGHGWKEPEGNSGLRTGIPHLVALCPFAFFKCCVVFCFVFYIT